MIHRVGVILEGPSLVYSLNKYEERTDVTRHLNDDPRHRVGLGGAEHAPAQPLGFKPCTSEASGTTHFPRIATTRPTTAVPRCRVGRRRGGARTARRTTTTTRRGDEEHGEGTWTRVGRDARDARDAMRELDAGRGRGKIADGARARKDAVGGGRSGARDVGEARERGWIDAEGIRACGGARGEARRGACAAHAR